MLGIPEVQPSSLSPFKRDSFNNHHLVIYHMGNKYSRDIPTGKMASKLFDCGY